MNRPELYRKTVDVLYEAYFNNTLQHADCGACAVGNLVAANMGYNIKILGKHSSYWSDSSGKRVNTVWGNAYTYPSEYRLDKLVKEQIDSTGYTFGEFFKIEDAFESALRGCNDEDWMFNGLAAVLETLKEIHEVTQDDELLRFKSHYQTLTSKP